PYVPAQREGRVSVHRDAPVASGSHTVRSPLRPFTATSPKCWNPSSCEVLAAGGACTNTDYGPKVGSSALGPNAPACSGPDTNSQNGSKSPTAARSGE